MTFSEKIIALMELTGVTNIELAKALDVDRSTVSRFKTGARKMPKPATIEKMAEFFAIRIADNYRASILFEITGDPRLQQRLTIQLVSDVIYSWFMLQNQESNSSVGRLLQSISAYSSNSDSDEPADLSQYPPSEDTKYTTYSGFGGKRQALITLFDYVLKMEESCTIRMFTDEDMEWLVEDPSYAKTISQIMQRLADKQCTFQRIQPPEAQLEYTFNSLERWLSVYMSGAVKQFYYPFSRDKLHRRTIVVIPGHIVMCSSSIANQKGNYLTILTRDNKIVYNYDRQYDLIMERCRPTMLTHTIDKPYELLSCLTGISSLDSDGIYKSSSLSASTLPETIIKRIERNSSPVAARMGEAFRLRIEARKKVLKNHVIADIMYLRPFEEVLAGRTKLLSTSLLHDGPYYYTPLEYTEHLENIIEYLEKYPNYWAILTENSMWENVIVYAKKWSNALIIKESDPIAIFEITEQTMSDSLWEYLNRVAENEVRTGSRHATITHLKEEAHRLRTAINKER